MGWFVILVVVVLAVYFAKRKRSDPTPVASPTPWVRVDAPNPGNAPPYPWTQNTQGPAAEWVPPGGRFRVPGGEITGGMVYVGRLLPAVGRFRATEPALIDPSLPVTACDPSDGAGMSYWPSYDGIASANRGAYLQWLATGRSHPTAYIGYVFLFFYGLERRALIDRQDLNAIRAEVKRLLGIYGANRSFRGYATNFLAVTHPRNGASADDEPLDSDEGRAMRLAWHLEQRKPLDPVFAASLASSMDEAKRGVVVNRSRRELLDLFTIRYREKFGDGLIVNASARETVITYQPASSGLASLRDQFGVRVPDVLGKPAQFKPLVKIWNDCVEDLKRYASAQKKSSSDELTREKWEAMPPDLQAQFDHPDKDRWDEFLATAVRAGPGRVITIAELAVLGEVTPRDRYTSAQLKKLADTAGYVGYAIEPDPRVVKGTRPSGAHVVLWQSPATAVPDTNLYSSVSIALTLALHIAAADGVVSPEETNAVSALIESLFTLDPDMRQRVEALREVLIRDPAKVAPIAKKLAEIRTETQRIVIGRLLVGIAGADRVITTEEHKALKALYKHLALPARALDAAIAATGVRLESDEPVVAVKGQAAPRGSAVLPPPPTSPKSVALDQQAIDAILADTREVAALLSDVLDAGAEDEQADDAPVSADSAPAIETPSSDRWTALTAALPNQYRVVLGELITRPRWTATEIRALAGKNHVMPGAVAETINEWSDDALGDHLIEDDGDWTIRLDLVERGRA